MWSTSRSTYFQLLPNSFFNRNSYVADCNYILVRLISLDSCSVLETKWQAIFHAKTEQHKYVDQEHSQFPDVDADFINASKLPVLVDKYATERIQNYKAFKKSTFGKYTSRWMSKCQYMRQKAIYTVSVTILISSQIIKISC